MALNKQHIALFAFALVFLVVFFFETVINFLYISSSDDEDWANLARYNTSNAELYVLSAGTNQVVFMGDSITDFWDLESYFPDKSYVNRGIGGQTTPQMIVRFRPDVLELQPEVVVLLAGTNDIASVTGFEPNTIIEGNLATMIELCNAHNIIPIVASLLPVCGDVVAERSPERILEVNSWLQSYAEENEYIYIDYHSAVVDSDGYLIQSYTDDCLHPNDAGYVVMKPLAEAAIEKALQSKTEALTSIASSKID